MSSTNKQWILGTLLFAVLGFCAYRELSRVGQARTANPQLSVAFSACSLMPQERQVIRLETINYTMQPNPQLHEAPILLSDDHFCVIRHRGSYYHMRDDGTVRNLYLKNTKLFFHKDTMYTMNKGSNLKDHDIHIKQFDPATGESTPFMKIPPHNTIGQTGYNNKKLYCLLEDNSVLVIDINNKSYKKTDPIPLRTGDLFPLIYADHYIQHRSEAGKLHVYNIFNSNEPVILDIGKDLAFLTVIDELLYTKTEDNKILTFDMCSGRLLDTYSVAAPRTSAITHIDKAYGMLFVLTINNPNNFKATYEIQVFDVNSKKHLTSIPITATQYFRIHGKKIRYLDWSFTNLMEIDLSDLFKAAGAV